MSIDVNADKPIKKVAILGAGAWGTALAIHFADYFETILWSIDEHQVVEMMTSRVNRSFFPDFRLPDDLFITDSLEEVLEADVLIVAVPTSALSSLFDLLKDQIQQPVILACKGFVEEKDQPPVMGFQYAESRLNSSVPIGILSGPTFAQEVAADKPTAVVLAFKDDAYAKNLAQQLHTPTMRTYSTTDRVGVSVGGSVKNVLAIATGLCDGMQLGYNARAALITRGLAETIRFGAALGARPETLSGLAGVGDLILTTTGELSRNRKVGLLLAQGHSLKEILDTLGHVAEGVNTAGVLSRWATRINIEMPIAIGVNDILEGRATPEEVLNRLIQRDPKAES